MADFTKLASYLDSFDKTDPNYDLVCFIKDKIATDSQDRETINNGNEEDLADNDVTMSTPDQQSSENTEGDLMAGAFKELDVMNQLKEEKEKINVDDKKDPSDTSHQELATNESFSGNVLNKKEASLFSLLQRKIKK